MIPLLRILSVQHGLRGLSWRIPLGDVLTGLSAALLMPESRGSWALQCPWVVGQGR
jgi:hypothetical protein